MWVRYPTRHTQDYLSCFPAELEAMQDTFSLVLYFQTPLGVAMQGHRVAAAPCMAQASSHQLPVCYKFIVAL